MNVYIFADAVNFGVFVLKNGISAGTCEQGRV